MTSAIDRTKPTEGQAYTADVRRNFGIAADEISYLQDRVASLETEMASLRLFAGIGTWQWQAPPQAGSITNAHIGLDTDNPAVATVLWVTSKSDDGSDFSAALAGLAAGDELMLWERKNSLNRMRYTVTAPATAFAGYFTVPIGASLIEGIEPANNQDINVQFIFAPRVPGETSDESQAS